MTPTLSLILNGLFLLLLAGTLFSTIKLSHHIRNMKDTRKDFEAMIRRFDESSLRAEASVQKLMNTAQGTGQALQGELNRARTLYDELSIMVEAAENLATRLERSAAGTGAAGTATGALAAATGAAPSSPPLAAAPAPRPSPMSRPAEAPAPTASTDPRSRAERELLRALLKNEGGETSS